LTRSFTCPAGANVVGLNVVLNQVPAPSTVRNRAGVLAWAHTAVWTIAAANSKKARMQSAARAAAGIRVIDIFSSSTDVAIDRSGSSWDLGGFQIILADRTIRWRNRRANARRRFSRSGQNESGFLKTA
jgi:hypothetical protein